MSEGAPQAPARPFWERMEQERVRLGWNKSQLYEEVRTKLGGKFSRLTPDRLRTQKRVPTIDTVNAIAEVLGIPLTEAHVLAGLIKAADETTQPYGMTMAVPDVIYDSEIERLYEALPPERRQLLERVRERERARLERQLRRAHEVLREDAEEAQRGFAELVRAEAEGHQTDEE